MTAHDGRNRVFDSASGRMTAHDGIFPKFADLRP